MGVSAHVKTHTFLQAFVRVSSYSVLCCGFKVASEGGESDLAVKHSAAERGWRF